MNDRSLHGTLKWVLVLFQCLGQMPVLGITEPDARFLKFTWKSWRCLYCILNCIGVSFLVAFFMYNAAKSGMDLIKFTTIAFHLCTLVLTLFFLKLAIDWPQLMQQWSSMESSMRSYGWPEQLHTKITAFSIIVLTTAAIETGFLKASYIFRSINCKGKNDEFFEYYFTVVVFPEIFAIVKYSWWKGVLLQVENLLITFVWSNNDLFIMLMSTALALRFKQVTLRVKRSVKFNNIHVWEKLREDYNRLSRLSNRLDDDLSYLILTSFAGNLFFIITRLFFSLREFKDIIRKTHFFFSFALLILRTLFVSIYGAWIYDESKEPLTILTSVSSDVYNVEIKRFIQQIKFDTVTLTGKNFFYLTRGLILSMTGAIVTYELVLIQFNVHLLNQSDGHIGNSTEKCH